MAAGDQVREFGMRRDRVPIKNSTTITRGQVLLNDAGAGYAPATATIADAYNSKPCIALEAVEGVIVTTGNYCDVAFEGEYWVGHRTATGEEAMPIGKVIGITATAGKLGTVSVANREHYGAAYVTKAALCTDTLVAVRLGGIM